MLRMLVDVQCNVVTYNQEARSHLFMMLGMNPILLRKAGGKKIKNRCVVSSKSGAH